VSKGQASYAIEGKINMKGEWQSTIYLATIDRLDNYYSANAEFIINSATIDTEGNFKLSGDNLPDHSQFYRLYLVKEENSEFNACLYEGGDNHNFVHLILNNQSDITIDADQNTFAPFGDYTLRGDIENQLMNNLGRLIYPSYMYYEIKFPSELQFSQNKLNKDLFVFADTCSSVLVSLAAINSTDYEGYFDTNEDRYISFGEILKSNFKDHPYTSDYLNKLRYYSRDYENGFSVLWKCLCGLLMFTILGLVYYIQKLRSRIKISPVESKSKLVHYTSQELKILDLIQKGNSNKEIASELFIELSTVKSHINKLYAKLNVKNRAQAKEMAKNIIKTGL